MAFMGYIVGEELCSSRKSVVTSQSSTGAVELRPYNQLYKVCATNPHLSFLLQQSKEP